jgi:CHAT domain-containing protein
MANINLEHAQLAYLSACHAAGSEGLTLLDEAIHMAGACQLAGYPVVIGTLWQVMDEYSENVAACVYKTMLLKHQTDAGGKPKASDEFPQSAVELDIRKAALCLHLAVRKVRDDTQVQQRRKKISNPMAWAPYICVGL